MKIDKKFWMHVGVEKMNAEFTLPNNCHWCAKKLDNKEIVVLADYKLLHPWCFLEMQRRKTGNHGVKYRQEEVDSLASIFKLQAEFQAKLKTEFDQDFINVMTLSAIDELMESLRETPWKPWKKQQELNLENYKGELVDVLHFFINLCLAAKLDARELYERYYKKMQENYARQARNY